MTLKKQNPWKLLSVGLLGVIAIGLLVPVDAVPPAGQKEVEATEVDCENPCIDETELTFDPATQTELDSTVGGLVAGQIADILDDLVTEADARANGDAALQTQIDGIVDQSCSAGDVVTGITADGEVQCASDDDTNSSNELNSSFSLDGTLLTITDAGNELTVDLKSLVDSAKTDLNCITPCVDGSEIVDGSVSGFDIGTLITPNIPDNLISSRMVGPNTLTGADIKDNAISLNTRLVTKGVIVPANGQASGFLTCGPGEVVGGLIPINTGGLVIQDIIALNTPEQYQIVYGNTKDSTSFTELWYFCVQARADIG